MTDTKIQQVPPHPLERMNGLAERITLPGSGIEVVVRKGDVEALSTDAMRFAFTTASLHEVAQQWAAEANEANKEPGQTPRPQPALDAAQALELSRQMETALLRAVVAAPKLDALIAEYGGDSSLPDLGLGSDYKVLKDAANRLNPPENKEQAKSPSEAVPAPASGDAEQPG